MLNLEIQLFMGHISTIIVLILSSLTILVNNKLKTNNLNNK